MVNLFESEAAAVPEEDKLRRARILLNKAKMQKMLGHLRGVQPHAENLLNQYLEYAKLDSKPEKGERKFADDFVLILDELLDEASSGEARNDASQISKIDLFRIGVLEHAISASPYNFDI